jgi:uncharacterized protein
VAALPDIRFLYEMGVLFASDEPWGDFNGGVVRMRAAAGDGELGEAVLRANFAALYDPKR